MAETRRPALALVACSLTALFVEVLLIRWVSAEIPVMAYFKNFPLLAAFAGLGVGSLLGGRGRSYFVHGLWALAGVAALVAAASHFGFHRLVFPDPRLDVWLQPGAGAGAVLQNARNLALVFVYLAGFAGAFVGLGQGVGALLRRGSALRMYTFDILGSLGGVVLFAVLSYLDTSPLVWLPLAAALLGLVGHLLGHSWRRTVLPLAVVAFAPVALYVISPGATRILWSPYYRITLGSIPVTRDGSATWTTLNVNRDFHQMMIDASPGQAHNAWKDDGVRGFWEISRRQYEFPYELAGRPASVLIAGAGTGNDVAAAVRHQVPSVTAVDIDPRIIAIGRAMHPEHPYASPTVHVATTDIRSFWRRTQDRFDLIVYSIIDSHTAISSLSSLRLENYVYTVEGVREAASHLTPDGIVSLAFHVGDREWLADRLYRVVEEATGRPPLVARIDVRVMFVFGPGVETRGVRARLASLGLRDLAPRYAGAGARPATDDWPFLYSHPAGPPRVYYLSLVLLVVLSAAWVAFVLRRSRRSEPGAPRAPPLRPDWPLFFLGAGFMLVETKALAELALLFGSTWIVNTFVFIGIFVMVLGANVAVRRGAGRHVAVAYALLAASLLAWYVFPRDALNALDYWPRAAVGTALVVLPLLFAGVLFAASFDRRPDASLAFGSNLIGAVLGGALEATSLAFGLRALTLLALACYGLAWATGRWTGAAGRQDAPSSRPPPAEHARPAAPTPTTAEKAPAAP